MTVVPKTRVAAYISGTSTLLVAIDIYSISSSGIDFHWYRLDQGGLWSHKPGETHVTRVDQAGNIIVDPRTAATGNYRFVTFMTSECNTVNIA